LLTPGHQEEGVFVQKLWTALSVVAAVLAGLIFFYPTPYRYEDGGMTRINRFTGTVQQASSAGWEAAKPTVSAEQADPVTPEVIKAFDEVMVAKQDFDSITLHNPGPWALVLIEKAEVTFDAACGNASDYVTFITAERSLNVDLDAVLRVPYSEGFKKRLVAACGGGTHKRTIALILNSGFNQEGTRWDAQSRLVTRKIDGDVAVPAS
jgi:hypothetical protein